MRLFRKLYSDDYFTRTIKLDSDRNKKVKGMAKYRNSDGIGVTGSEIAVTLLAGAPGASSYGAHKGRIAMENATRYGEQLTDEEIIKIARKAGGKSGALFGTGVGGLLGSASFGVIGAGVGAGLGATGGYLGGKHSAGRNAKKALELRDRDPSNKSKKKKKNETT